MGEPVQRRLTRKQAIVVWGYIALLAAVVIGGGPALILWLQEHPPHWPAMPVAVHVDWRY
jgi:fatty acid desaturase